MVPALHPDVAPLAPLLGTWVGQGEGSYPTTEPFRYTETLTFGHVGKPFLTYQQRTMSADGTPMHAETGYWRCPSPARVELVIAHPIGVAEVEEGTFDGKVAELRSTGMLLTSSAKEVTALRRRFELAGDELSYTLDMAAVGVPLTHHLRATLFRQP